jgi:ATP-binding cassette subfamily B protein
MNNDALFMKNNPLSKGALALVERLKAQGAEMLFAIVGDLSLSGRYAGSALIFTKDTLYVYDEESGEKSYSYPTLSDVRAKRMYGNATLSAMIEGKRRILFRYTYAVATLCDAAARFLNRVSGTPGAIQEEFAIMGVAFERSLSVCPKCGRTLLHPGAECIRCRSKMKVVKRLFAYIKPHLPTIIFCIFLSLFTTAMALVPPSITGFIVDKVFPTGEMTPHENPIFATIQTLVGSDRGRLLWSMVIALLLVYMLQFGIGILRAYLMRSVGDRAVSAMRLDIYEKCQYLPMKFYDKTSTGAVINRVASDCSTLQNFMLRITQEAVVHFFQMIGIVVIMLTMNPSLTLLSLAPVPVIVLISRFFSKRLRPYYRRIWRKWTRVFSTLSDTIPCIKVIKSFSAEKRASERFREKNEDWLRVDLRLGKIATAFPQIVSFFVTCGSLIIWGFGGSRVISGEAGYSAGLVVSFISYAAMFYNPVTFFANLSDSFQSAMASTEKVLDILEAEPETSAEAHIVPAQIQGRIEFNHVHFSFDRTKKVLDDVSFTIEPGEVVGIVGTTGSGKSTLIHLLMRFYDGYSGEILVDGHNIKNLDLAAYRSMIGYVQQEPMMFSDTIFNNIAYGNPDASVEDVIHAADVANAHCFIARQPDGYDTVLGERGVGVSGGEKQRISIARAVLSSPSILIFDEATAAVDSETEHLIQEAIDRLIAGKTTLMIAHRLSTLRRATRILVVDNGRIIENGSPEELMALKGKYYKLVQIQTMAQEAEEMRTKENF